MNCQRRISLSVLISHNYYFMFSPSPRRAALKNAGRSGSSWSFSTWIEDCWGSDVFKMESELKATPTHREPLHGWVWVGNKKTATHCGTQATEAVDAAAHQGQHTFFSLSGFLSHICACESNTDESRWPWPRARWLQANRGKVWEGRWKNLGNSGRGSRVVSFYHCD